MNLANKVFLILVFFNVSFAGAQKPATVPNVKDNQIAPVTSTADPIVTKPPTKERPDQILVDPFSGGATSSSVVDINTNPDLANFVDQTLVGLIVGETKKIAVLQSSTGLVGRYKKNEKINAEYKILDIFKDHILVASIDNNEYEVYFNNVIKPVEKKKIQPKKQIKSNILDSTTVPIADPLVPKSEPEKKAPVKNTKPEKLKKKEPTTIVPSVLEKQSEPVSELKEPTQSQPTTIVPSDSEKQAAPVSELKEPAQSQPTTKKSVDEKRIQETLKKKTAEKNTTKKTKVINDMEDVYDPITNTLIPKANSDRTTKELK